MRPGKIIKYIAIGIPLLIAVVVIAAIAVLMSTDFNRYKPLIAEETKKATGRDLVIAGDLELNVSLTPSVSVAGVTLSNAKWGARPEMIRVERFEAQISLIPAVFGVIDVKRVVLIGADILLEVDKKGQTNFALLAPGAAPPTKPAEGEAPAAPAAGGGAPPIPVIREVVVRDSRLVYTDAKAGARYDVAIKSLTVRGDGPTAPVELLYEGSYNTAPVRLAVMLGAPADILAGKPLSVDLTLEAGGAEIAVKGQIADPMAVKGIDLTVSVSGEELGELSALAGSEIPRFGAYSMSAGVTGDLASTLKLVRLKAELAGSDVAGDVTVRLSGKRPFINAVLSSQTIDVTALGAVVDGVPAGGGTGGGGATPTKKSTRIFPNDPLPLEGLRSVDAAVKFQADTIIAGGAQLRSANVGLSLKGGILNIKPLKAGIAKGTIDGAVRLDGRTSSAKLAIKTNLSKVDLQQLLEELDITGDVEGQANINIDVKGRGKSVRAIMATLGGSAGLLMGKGRMKDSFLQSLLGGSGKLLNKTLDKGRSGYTAIECAVADFGVAKGVATARALYLDLDSRGVIGQGTANLGNETLNLTIDPRRKKSMDKAALPVRITGTFLAPKYKIDNKVAAQKLTRALGLKLPDSLTGGKSDPAPVIDGPCAPPQPAAAAQPAPAQTTQPVAPTQTEDPVKRAEEKLKNKLKGLLGQ